eukprot:gnl/TRDRNA2_/TRDRNA2_180011_c0_seq1.p1 gnl/TRDRNA2_/TRDRNA2_180011_c0~~gnl/TRDRNA2_/TRDRNA2_180011_c0_seq1.p1  ORF type:complete len:352 (-),score=108.11 gnl/TRDRNA2_/TRDRNA2_180011_c0_seq1:86-1141(-)
MRMFHFQGFLIVGFNAVALGAGKFPLKQRQPMLIGQVHADLTHAGRRITHFEGERLDNFDVLEKMQGPGIRDMVAADEERRKTLKQTVQAQKELLKAMPEELLSAGASRNRHFNADTSKAPEAEHRESHIQEAHREGQEALDKKLSDQQRLLAEAEQDVLAAGSQMGRAAPHTTLKAARQSAVEATVDEVGKLQVDDQSSSVALEHRSIHSAVGQKNLQELMDEAAEHMIRAQDLEDEARKVWSQVEEDDRRLADENSETGHYKRGVKQQSYEALSQEATSEKEKAKLLNNLILKLKQKVTQKEREKQASTEEQLGITEAAEMVEQARKEMKALKVPPSAKANEQSLYTWR